MSSLWEKADGRAFLLKLAVLPPVAGTGAYNCLRVNCTLRDGAGAARLRRSGSLKLAVGALVFVVTAVPAATPTPTDGMPMEP